MNTVPSTSFARSSAREPISSRRKSKTKRVDVLFAKANDLDPDNHWLWARQWQTHDLRTAARFVAGGIGQLDYRVGGRARALFGEGDNARRTLYGLVDRQFLSGVLRSFDFANPDLHIPQRSETTVPQQALFELNHDFSANVARSLAAQVDRAHGDESTAAKVNAMFRRVLSRAPSAQELHDAIEFIQQTADLVPKPREEVRDWKYGFGKYNRRHIRSRALQHCLTSPARPGKADRNGPMTSSAGLS